MAMDEEHRDCGSHEEPRGSAADWRRYSVQLSINDVNTIWKTYVGPRDRRAAEAIPASITKAAYLV
ncbi:hypothetical protein SNOG_05899 [Parastagonospora nodorum SN15]|uniref:Uncharacterized protein n=1 Tax=Phaeosphaeria nodorum (strain SN15 / ATCC MYA-4574 / FGSC 10173) TaxID=321614 RepID=Q0UQR5_PHANO|nr:hypothetical protein SNOG_05899 [Parastagonospora nodorum SN15]EAT86963.1 hypothetical protein SNOG_05899 [Parastagonospora nodorum SN15]